MYTYLFTSSKDTFHTENFQLSSTLEVTSVSTEGLLYNLDKPLILNRSGNWSVPKCFGGKHLDQLICFGCEIKTARLGVSAEGGPHFC